MRVLWESHTGAYIGTGDAILKYLKIMVGSFPFLILFRSINWKMKVSMQCRVACPLSVITMMLKDIQFLLFFLKKSSACTSGRTAEYIKNKNKLFKKRRRRLLLLYRREWIKTKHSKTCFPSPPCLWLLHPQFRLLWSVNAPSKMNRAMTQETTLSTLVTTEERLDVNVLISRWERERIHLINLRLYTGNESIQEPK